MLIFTLKKSKKLHFCLIKCRLQFSQFDSYLWLQEALIVNPYEVNKVADYLHNSLTMSEAEAEVRMISLRKRKCHKFSISELEFGLKNMFESVNENTYWHP